MKKFTDRLTPAKVFAVSVFVVLTGFILTGCIKYAKYSKLTKEILTTFDVTLSSLVQKQSDAYSVTDTDPQIIIEGHRKVGIVSFEMKSILYTGEVIGYYKLSPEDDWSPAKRVRAQKDGDEYSLDFGGREVYSIRIDPTIYAGNLLEIGEITINKTASLTDFITPSLTDIFYGVIALCSVFSMMWIPVRYIKK